MLDYANSLLAALQHSRTAETITNSLYLTAGLSGVHLLGFTLLMGSALVANLRLVGIVLPNLPVSEVTGPTRRAIAIGLTISVTTGLLLFSTRATTAVENGIFQLKMILLLSASAFHFAVLPRFGVRDSGSSGARRITAAVSLLLWVAVALAGCAFILLE
jgi:hypothetical protein